jgi:hypothetical protein
MHHGFNAKSCHDIIAVAIGMWPSGKAPGFGPGIRGFESLHPSHAETGLLCPVFAWLV